MLCFLTKTKDLRSRSPTTSRARRRRVAPRTSPPSDAPSFPRSIRFSPLSAPRVLKIKYPYVE